jgi:hypothetical protein
MLRCGWNSANRYFYTSLKTVTLSEATVMYSIILFLMETKTKNIFGSIFRTMVVLYKHLYGILLD